MSLYSRMTSETDGQYGNESMLLEFAGATHRVQSVQMAILTSSIIINSTLFVHFVRKKKHRKTFHLAYLNQAGSDLLLACFSVFISLPGLLNIFSVSILGYEPFICLNDKFTILTINNALHAV